MNFLKVFFPRRPRRRRRRHRRQVFVKCDKSALVCTHEREREREKERREIESERDDDPSSRVGFKFDPGFKCYKFKHAPSAT